MVRISSVEFQKNIGRYQDAALVEPVTVTRNGRDRIVLMSVEEYQRLKRRSRQALRTVDLPDAEIDAVRQLHRAVVAAAKVAGDRE